MQGGILPGRSRRARWVRPAALGGALILVLILLDSRLGPMPPVARFFSPFSGFWRNADGFGAADETLSIPGLLEPVSVVFDKRQVPHIFAQNAHDLFFAQGYVTARDRLWQMEIQARSSAGRLSEVLGPKFLEHDRFQRRLGIPLAAERSLELLKTSDESWQAAKAYSDGVNAWIQALDPEDYPLEYKLMDYAPGHWSPVNTALLLKNLQWTLSGGGDDLPMTNTMAKLGRNFMGRFFALRNPDVPPVIPAGTVWDTAAPGPIAAKPDSGSFRFPAALLPVSPKAETAPRPKAPGPQESTAPAMPAPPAKEKDPIPGKTDPAVPSKSPDPGNGSNNFAISGARTASGHPILAVDPHLDLGLPSLWYEVQLSAPGMGVYGVSLPGAPAVIIGYNRKVAWGMTNGTDDVFDWYRITFKDGRHEEYLHGGQWKPTRRVVEAIKVRGRATVLDTVIYTHHGPVALKDQEKPANRNTPALHALRWLALEPSDELLAFLRLMKAGDYATFSAALDPFHCPSQNFAFAAVDGDIAMIHHGLYPRKWKGQGRFTLDGSEPGNDWSGWLPRRDEPSAHNPAQGWLFSANQSPTDSTYPFYLGAGYLNGARPRRLARLLSEADSLTPAGAFAIMQDDYGLHASELLPVLLPRLAGNPLSSPDSGAWRELAEWDFRHGPEKRAPAIFDLWWRTLYKSIWADEFGGDSVHYQWPSKDRTRRMILEEPEAEWFEDISTPGHENLSILAVRTFRDACASLRKRRGGPPDWAAYRPVDVRHLARIDAFGVKGLATGGCADCVNSLKSTHGPSWRMVVDLSPQPRGYGIYPGGQSGNPGSPHYAEFIGDWAAGRHYELSYLSDPAAAGPETSHRLQLRGK